MAEEGKQPNRPAEWRSVAPPDQFPDLLQEQALDPGANESIEDKLPRNTKVRRIVPMHHSFYREDHGH